MMASSLNVIALISGGKDSLFSILHCQANGHTIVALANLHPAASANGNEDIDSYMYQTVGHSVIPLYEQALGIPLYRQEITGKAVNSSRDYEISSQQEQDETEDLVPLLEKIIKVHPEANAVSTGAILSTYQRTRVESVALRLGLVPLSYLWQYPLLPPYTQSSLLHDMAAVGQEAIIIKTASGGLDESFLGLDVANSRTVAKLSKAMNRFGTAGNGAIVGEGGEFETLTLGGPRSLWKRRIQIGASDSMLVDGGQTMLRIRESSLEELPNGSEEDSEGVRIPELFDEEFRTILKATDDEVHEDAKSICDTTLSTNPVDSTPVTNRASVAASLPMNACNNTPTVFTYSNIVSDIHGSKQASPSRQVMNVFLRLDHMIQQCDLLKSNINHCTLLLRDMADFTILNPIYAQYFSDVNPPARVTIAAGNALPRGTDAMLSVILDKNVNNTDPSISRQGLHVQGRSYWAPANIGPYSQAISVPLPARNHTDITQEEKQPVQEAGKVVYIAGQIPLIPASMAVYQPHDFRGQALLSLQHLWRIGRAKGVKHWTASVAFLPSSLPNPHSAVQTAQALWKKAHAAPPPPSPDDDNNNDIDPWDRINNTTTNHAAHPCHEYTHRPPLPDYSSLLPPPTPPCFVAQVHSLPRAAHIEWSATGLTASSISVHVDGDASSRSPTYTSAPAQSASAFHAIEMTAGDARGSEEICRRKWAGATVYVGRGFAWGKGGVGWEGVQWVPCVRVWGREGVEVSGVLVGRVDGGA
ncbi:hypothetical protein BDU57DRAFT_1693 [Ampelomyces quisqualis]|uniref:Diphthine--ammonia ligase n=1 Tax=Ampelomyces quisqualis TaxID=50730 RepID=A0A6A5QX83_AMPQU|nr:hypothetical protein BDU57DRAFT_1693 [Ampelomyces quisqualis]